MAEPVVSLVLDTLRDLLVEEVKLIGRVGNEVEELQTELERMRSFLKDADSRQHEGARLLNWVREVRNLAYKAEDILEEYVVQVSSKRGSGIKKLLRRFSCIVNECISLHVVGKEITNIKIQIANLSGSLQTYGIIQTDTSEVESEAEKQILLRQTFAHNEDEDEDFVGMEDDIKKVISFVVDNKNEHNNVISIYGMGGSGKTTIARKVYNHPDVKQVFSACAWVCITQTCQSTTILHDLLKQLTTNSNNNNFQEGCSNYNELVRAVYQVMQEVKCLVVLDDIWKIEDWKILAPAFPLSNSETKSKLLLTTRTFNVADVGYIWDQRLLNGQESLQLLKSKVFNQHDTQISKLKNHLFDSLGREMVKKCGGLPLGISVLGGILRGKNTSNEWEMIITDISGNLNEGSYYPGGKGETVEKVLALSYNDLPYYLKPCFMYMGAFQEDVNVKPRKLYHLWIADGLVSTQYCMQEETLMDVAERFLKELISRCMVEGKVDPILGRLGSCRVHDLMRDLSLRKAKEEDFLYNINMHFQDRQTADINESISKNVRRVAIHWDRDLINTRCLKPFDQISGKFLRALSFHRLVFVPVSASRIRKSRILTLMLKEKEEGVEILQAANFRLLRVFDFEDCRFNEGKLPRRIGKLFHLRYICLYQCHVEEFPSSVGDLPLLQALDLRTSCSIKIPYDMFSKKKPMKHLYLKKFECAHEEKLQVSGLCDLETLVLEDDGIYKLESRHLSRLVNIRYFKVKLFRSGHKSIEIMLEEMESWKKIKRLEIEKREGKSVGNIFMSKNITDLTLISVSSFLNSPKYEPRFCQNLVKLVIVSCTNVDDGLMKLLGEFPNLRMLRLAKIKESLREITLDKEAFRELRLLELESLNELEKLVVEEGSLSNLVGLSIRDCKRLEVVPENGLKYFHSLKTVEIIVPEDSSYEDILDEDALEKLKKCVKRLTAKRAGLV